MVWAPEWLQGTSCACAGLPGLLFYCRLRCSAALMPARRYKHTNENRHLIIVVAKRLTFEDAERCKTFSSLETVGVERCGEPLLVGVSICRGISFEKCSFFEQRTSFFCNRDKQAAEGVVRKAGFATDNADCELGEAADA